MRITKKIKDQQIEILGEVYKDVKPALIFKNPFELLIAVILSAQCTDKRVNVTTARLFAKAPTPEAIIDMGIEALENEIRDCGLFHNKAKNIMATCRTLVEEFSGEVPSDYDTLLKLPGVGRKTANVVTSIAFNRPAIAVDTHVFRVANRLKLAVGDTPLQVEQGLMKAIPKDKWSAAHHWLIWHGRKLCRARNPLCGECPLNEICPSKEV
ncbi:MAG: endonuclease III [Selenomonadales bacterium]|jgi:endonuclease-3|nr:endonuclease III [Selenomonadales bacterium]MDY3739795.1 endonuclease III [Selenomonadaceae bacterium]MEE1361023.1 endonuclease III [Selenomonadaceae bacterium]